MKRFLVRRLLTVPPTLLMVTFVVFLLSKLAPGDVAVTLAGGAAATPEAIAAIREQLRLDDPLVTQYLSWLQGALTFDFGTSLFNGDSVAASIAARLPVTMGLVACALMVAMAIGVPLGAASGIKPGGIVDRVGRLVSSFAVGVPNFVLSALLIVVFAVYLQWLPPSGYVSFAVDPSGWLRHIVLPAFAMGVFLSAELNRQIRTGLIRELETNYVRTLWSKGAGKGRVIGLHAMRNAISPALTVLGVQVGTLLGGSVITEQVFAIPGLGTYLLQGIVGRDIPVVLGVVTVFVVIQMAMSLFVDLLYVVLNPRIRVS